MTEEPLPSTHYNPQVPAAIEVTILKALSKQRTDRHANVLAFVADDSSKLPYRILRCQPHVSNAYPPSLHHNPPHNQLLQRLSYQQEQNNSGNTGYKHSHAGRFTEALAAFDQALSLDPNDAALAYAWKGYCSYRLQRYEEALVACEQAISLNPKMAGAYSNKGHALQQLGRLTESQKAYKQARRLG